MFKRSLSAVALAGLLATVVHAQPAVPAPSGEASTRTPAGEPNPTQRPDRSHPNSRDGVRAGAVWNNHNPAHTTTPGGEVSTMTNNQPNATPQVGQRTRAEVRQEALHTPRPFGQTGERPDVGTNPKDKTGTPK